MTARPINAMSAVCSTILLLADEAHTTGPEKPAENLSYNMRLAGVQTPGPCDSFALAQS